MSTYLRYSLLRTIAYIMAANLLVNNLVLLLYLEWEWELVLLLGTALILFFAFVGLLGSFVIGIKTLLGFRNLGTHIIPLFLSLLQLPLNIWYVYILN